jgi:hypothetical protein
MTTKVDICEPKVFPASTLESRSMGDSGLGFGQGSVAGVYNQYSYKGFHRPQHPEIDRGLRRRFNLRGFRGSRQYDNINGEKVCGSNPYRCHYDPEPYFDEYTLPEHKYTFDDGNLPGLVGLITGSNSNNDFTKSFDLGSHINTVASLIIIIIALFLWFV